MRTEATVQVLMLGTGLKASVCLNSNFNILPSASGSHYA